MLINFLSGNIKYLVDIGEYNHLTIYDFDSYLINNGKSGLKLLSIFGNSKGDIFYGSSSNSEGYGTYNNIVPFDDKEKALKYLKTVFYERLKKGLNDKLMKTAEEYNLEIPEHLLKEWKNQCKNNLEKRIISLKEDIQKLEQEKNKYY